MEASYDHYSIPLTLWVAYTQMSLLHADAALSPGGTRLVTVQRACRIQCGQLPTTTLDARVQRARKT